MKINTKTATPIKDSPHSFQNENTFIPATKFNNDGGGDDDDDDKGRTILFHTVVVSTPVLASARLLNQPDEAADKKKRFLTKNEVDELNGMLNSLYLDTAPISTSAKETKATTTTSVVVHKEEKVAITKDDVESPSTTFLGRCSLVLYDAKTNDFIQVLRSARLAFRQQ